jgi:hypothetical protein
MRVAVARLNHFFDFRRSTDRVEDHAALVLGNRPRLDAERGDYSRWRRRRLDRRWP